jgi:tripartite-type tricarboxylate transporter receptor subunit TctC
MKRLAFIGLFGGAAAILSSVAPIALAQSFPSRPVNVIVPFPPGGNTDIMARALQNEMSRALSQTMVIINKPGAAGTLGLIELSRAASDGYTLALTPNNPLTAQPHVQKLPYDMASFRYVCLTYDVPYVLIASPKAPFATFAEFMAFAKAKNDNLIYASPGPGTQPHLGILAVLNAIKAEGVHVPFTGAGPMSQAMLAGTVMAMAESPAVAKASNLKVLAALAKTRIAALPDVPTMIELGYPAEAFTAGGIVAPARTPDAAVARLQKACAEAVASDGYKSASDKLNAIARYLPEAEFKALFEADSVRNAEAVKKAGIAP